MSNPGDLNDTPIESKAQLITLLADGAKPQASWRIGTEHEKFGFVLPDDRSGREAYSPPAYAPDGIEALLHGFRGDGSTWESIEDHGKLIGLKGQGAHKGESVSLEPAGQFELSGRPTADLHETKAEMDGHFADLRAPARHLGLVLHRSAFSLSGRVMPCRSCPRAVTPSCVATCPRWVRSAST